MAQRGDEQPVPRLPRGRGLKLSGPELFRIAVTGAMLVAVVVLARPCANAVSGFVTRFDQGSGQGSAMAKPGAIDVAPADAGEHYIHRTEISIDGVMAEIRKAREREGVGSSR